MYTKVSITITPEFGAANLTAKNDMTWDFNFTLSQNLQNPEMHIDVYELLDSQFSRRFFKISLKICDLNRMIKASPFLRVAAIMLKERTNLRLECPLAAGHYYMRNVELKMDLIPLRLFYRPNTTDIINVVLTTEKIKGRKVKATHTFMEAKIIKAKSHRKIIILNSHCFQPGFILN